jgi:CobQ-like glutamine amidotransferase family enzyme
MRIKNVIGTLLHGPVLAKNAWLAELIIEAIFERREVSLPPVQAIEKADQVAGLISKVWELEEPLARE